MKTLTVALPGREYDILIGCGLLEQAGEQLCRVLPRAERVFVVTDSHVAELYLDVLTKSLTQAGLGVSSAVIPAGEGSKCAARLAELWESMMQAGLTRTDAVVALGGGVVGDLVGFAAATYLRGVDYAQIPTTLLSAVDSSVGGKTAVDLTVGKNLVGAFHQPILVWCDTDTLATLPPVTFRDGCAEVIKYGLLDDAEFFAYLRENRDTLDLTHVIARCVDMKRSLVVLDEFDRGLRQLLNLGHTFGHAIESVSDYSIPHGHCVAMGMAMICRAAAAMGAMSASDAAAVEEVLTLYGLPTHVPYSLEELSDAVLSDKKIRGHAVALVMPRAIGSCEIQMFAASALPRWLAAGGAV